MHESSFVMIKPDGIERNLADQIISRIKHKGLNISSQKDIFISSDLAEKLYEEHKNKSFYPGLLGYMTKGKVKVMKVEGENAIQIIRDLMGNTYPDKALSGTIRGDFKADNPDKSVIKNVIHGSDSAKSAEREIKIFF